MFQSGSEWIEVTFYVLSLYFPTKREPHVPTTYIELRLLNILQILGVLSTHIYSHNFY